MKTLDMQGNPCPIPVVNAKKALAEQGADGVVVLVDNFVAVQNLEKMAKGTGCGFSYTDEGASLYKVTITKDPKQAFNAPPEDTETASNAPTAGGAKKGPVVLITADSMGRGAEDLGKLLIKGFIFSLTQLNPLPEAVIFLNGGAHLTTEGANTVPDLKVLQEKGTEVYTCGTCANYYKLTESLAVGSIVDMMKITNTLAKASGLITL
ncbi:selenium metabolism protein YedF [Treponema primitia ZAS-2]|uniref:Putative N-terminal SirA family protein n=1 Tax=Treponema primitia (strain ATCC BAA-887 / DSM 12427 / ZAS-2) TaxID=545694 RepID=D8L164_TREPZ|nr:sulfurtransferase-like selenium metabolism protein YedF [Treponema primitia]ADJ19608.1 putative N-terminal SirA family protein [Treponema primitia ZAS-2]AEF86199.1 selenium metabolism protein YedF [Treponema primitia ZAS-2]